MPTNSVQEIYNEYKTAKEYSTDYTLDFFSKNSLAFNRLQNFNEEELHFYIVLVAQYLHALFEKGRFNETVDASIKYSQIIDSEFERLKVFVKDEWYYNILLFKGMAAYRLRDYKVSAPLFKKLIEHDPKSENYENWFKFSKYFQRKWILNLITVTCTLLTLIVVFFDKYISSFFINISLVSIALAGLIGIPISLFKDLQE